MKAIFLIIIITTVGTAGYFMLKKTPTGIESEVKATSTAQKIIKSAGVKSTKSAVQSTISAIASKKTTPAYLPNILDSQIPAGFKREQLSPYFGEIKISSATYSSSENNPSQIKINYISQDKSKLININISGWKIKSNRSELTIPKAINIYNPLNLQEETNIIFETGNNLNIYSNSSPINRNFRLNKCIGYLNNSYKFIPTLSSNCPPIYKDRSEIATFAGYCQTYIMSISGCNLPKIDYYNSLPGTDEGNACRNFLNTITHGNCFQKHQKDSDFLSKEWRVWVNQNTLLDPQHDRLLLFDENKLLVNQYIY